MGDSMMELALVVLGEAGKACFRAGLIAIQDGGTCPEAFRITQVAPQEPLAASAG